MSDQSEQGPGEWERSAYPPWKVRIYAFEVGVGHLVARAMDGRERLLAVSDDGRSLFGGDVAEARGDGFRVCSHDFVLEADECAYALRDFHSGVVRKRPLPVSQGSPSDEPQEDRRAS